MEILQSLDHKLSPETFTKLQVFVLNNTQFSNEQLNELEYIIKRIISETELNYIKKKFEIN